MVLYWIVPSLLCLALHWRSFNAWFRADDFAWLSVGMDGSGFRGLLHALFAPSPHGTIRPLSERALFMAAYNLFGLDPLPFRIAAFATQFANLALLAAIGWRISGVRAAGFWAAVFWALNSSLLYPLAWACNYCEEMCGLCLLLAFYFLLRYVESGERRYNVWQWAVFLVGFGALELNVVYPALAATYTWLCARKYFRQTLPMFAVSAVYAAVHNIFAPSLKSGLYSLHLTGAVVRTFAVYWTWSVQPAFLRLPHWLALAAALLPAAGLAVFVVRKTAGGHWRTAVLRGVVPGASLAFAAAARSPHRILRFPACGRPVLVGRVGRWLRHGAWASVQEPRPSPWRPSTRCWPLRTR